jgi:hypothetical protein
MKKFIFLGVKGKEYNFPNLKIYGLTTENITEAIAAKLYEAKSPLVKLAKDKE